MGKRSCCSSLWYRVNKSLTDPIFRLLTAQKQSSREQFTCACNSIGERVAFRRGTMGRRCGVTRDAAWGYKANETRSLHGFQVTKCSEDGVFGIWMECIYSIEFSQLKLSASIANASCDWDIYTSDAADINFRGEMTWTITDYSSLVIWSDPMTTIDLYSVWVYLFSWWMESLRWQTSHYSSIIYRIIDTKWLSLFFTGDNFRIRVMWPFHYDQESHELEIALAPDTFWYLNGNIVDDSPCT